MSDDNLRAWVEARGTRPEPAGDSALVLMVPDADALVAPLRDRSDPAAAMGVGAHLTVLYPFMPADLLDRAVVEEVGRLAAAHQAFDLELTRVRTFPGVVYLAVDPEAPVRALTEAAVARWPEHPPYGGVFEHPIPHLTVGHGGEELKKDAAGALEPHLPLRARATRLDLLVFGGERWRTRASFPLCG